MAEKLIEPQSPAEGQSAAPADNLAARAGRAVRRLSERMRALGDLAGAGLGPTVQTVRQDLGNAFGHLQRARYLGTIVVGAVLVLYVLSGTYVVSPGEVAVVTRFGRVAQARVTPGLHWHLPWPVEAAWTVNVAQVPPSHIHPIVRLHQAID